MSTKASLLESLDTFISAVGLVTKERHTDANSLLVDEFYPTVYREEVGGGLTITEEVTAGIYYDLRFVKQGNVVHVTGEIFNTTSDWIFSPIFFKLLNADFKPKDAELLSGNQIIKVTGNNTLTWYADDDNPNGALGGFAFAPSGFYEINTTYFT